MITRRHFLTTAAAAAASGMVGANSLGDAAPSPGNEQRPNILIYMPDQQQGQTVLPGYPCLTPNIDRFASQGVLFSNAFCPAPHCCPSRASFQTGLYPSEHGVFNNVNTATAIHADPYSGTKYFSEYLSKVGYELAYSGKWHVGRTVLPQDCGWRNLTAQIGSEWSTKKYPGGFKQNDEDWSPASREFKNPEPRMPGEVIRPGWGNIDLYGTSKPGPHGYGGRSDYDWVRTGMEGMKTLAGGNKPWCLMVSDLGSHDRYDVPKKYLDMYDPKSISLPANFRDTLEDKPRIYERMRYQYWSQLSDDEVRQCIAHYWALVTMHDDLFGLLLDTLEKTGQADNTMVVYTSDHGDYAGAHGLWGKGVPSFREGYNIPCVIRWPRGIKNPGRQIDAFVSTTDFAPTFLDLAGVPSSEYKMSGMSVLPWLRGETPANWRGAIFGQLNGVELYYTQRIVMTKDYKYVYNGFDYDEMYDLRHDPHEMVNLAFPDVKLKRARMEQGDGMENANNVPWPPLLPGLSEARLDLLKRMWGFANEHNDQIFDSYMTVAMAPYGPAVAYPG